MNALKFEADYVRRLLAREPEVEGHFTAHFGKLLRIKVRVRSRGWSGRQVDDIVQETFVRVLTALQEGRLDDPEKLGGFVSRVCDNVLHEFGRAGGRLRSIDESVPDPRASDDPEATAASRQGLALARELLAALPERDREILELVLVQEADKDEVCRRFGVTREHLRVLIHRAKERFRALADRPRREGRGL